MFEELTTYGIVPVVAVDRADDGLKLCETLTGAGLPVAEITFRTEAAEETIRRASAAFPDLLLGAGTVLTPEQARRAKDAGARFAVAPGCRAEVVEAAAAVGLPFAPGVCTPSDVERAVALGCRTLKFFPAEAAGGVRMLKALSGPYGHLGLSFCPTGGINQDNMAGYLSMPHVGFVGGSWVAKKELIRAGDWSTIASLAAAAVAAAAACRA